MFDLFKPKLPLALSEKIWIERRIGWLAERFGIHRLTKAEVILPTRQFFPDEYRNREEDVPPLFRQVCKHMGVDAAEIELQFLSDNETTKMGLYVPGDHPIIAVHRFQLVDQEGMIATMTHEIAHHILLGRKHLSGKEADMEQLTDLLPVFMGLGIFGANDVIQERQHRMGNLWFYQAGKKGYLTGREHGYALAVCAWLRHETRPPWAWYLALDAKKAFQQGLRYLLKTGDALLDRDRAVQEPKPPTGGVLQRHLESGRPSERLFAIQSVANERLEAAVYLPHHAAVLVASLRTSLTDSEPNIRSESATALKRLSTEAAIALPDLIEALRDPVSEVKIEAALAIGAIAQPEQGIVEMLASLLVDDDRLLVRAAAEAISRLKVESEATTRLALDALRPALAECDDDRVNHLVAAIVATSAEPRAAIKQRFDGNREFCNPALEALRSLTGAIAP